MRIQAEVSVPMFTRLAFNVALVLVTSVGPLPLLTVGAAPADVQKLVDSISDLPTLPDTFRYGFCRDNIDQPWRLYRLRYFSDNARQELMP